MSDGNFVFWKVLFLLPYLTPKQRALVQFIQESSNIHGRAPKQREMQNTWGSRPWGRYRATSRHYAEQAFSVSNGTRTAPLALQILFPWNLETRWRSAWQLGWRQQSPSKQFSIIHVHVSTDQLTQSHFDGSCQIQARSTGLAILRIQRTTGALKIHPIE